jgi:hypothetical protein
VVDIVVSIVSADPPVGHVTTAPGRTSTAFVGWLGLLRLLADAVGDEPISRRPTTQRMVRGLSAGARTDQVLDTSVSP